MSPLFSTIEDESELNSCPSSLIEPAGCETRPVEALQRRESSINRNQSGRSWPGTRSKAFPFTAKSARKLSNRFARRSSAVFLSSSCGRLGGCSRVARGLARGLLEGCSWFARGLLDDLPVVYPRFARGLFAHISSVSRPSTSQAQTSLISSANPSNAVREIRETQFLSGVTRTQGKTHTQTTCESFTRASSVLNYISFSISLLDSSPALAIDRSNLHRTRTSWRTKVIF